MAYTAEQIKSAVEQSLAQGFNMDQVYQGALANFGVSKADVDAALQNPSLSNPLYSKVQEFISNNQPGYNPEMAYTPVGQFQENGRTITVQPDGTYDSAIELGNGLISTQVYDSSGNLLKDYVFNRNEKSYLSPFVNALKAAAIGTVLGPAGIGLSAPVAAAGGAGLGNLASGGDLKSAITSAALAGTSAYGLGSLFGTPIDDFVTADVAQLAAQGITEEQIAQILTQEGLSSTAISAALDKQFGTSAPGSAKASSDFSSGPGLAEQVAVTGQNAGTGALSSLAPGLAALVPTFNAPSVQVTGQNFNTDITKAITPETLASTIPAITGGTQSVNVTGSNPKVTNETLGSLTGAIVPGITPAIPTAADKVEVTGKKETQVPLESLVGSALPGLTTAITDALPKATEPKKDSKTNTDLINNAIKLLTLIGGSAAASNSSSGGSNTGTGSIPKSNPLNYDDSYYQRIQQYYDQYMPNYPRDVATPLREWYGSGSMGTSGGSTGTSGGVGAPGTVVGSLFGNLLDSSVTDQGGTKKTPQDFKKSYDMLAQNLLSNPQYGGQYYGSGLLNLGGLPPNLSKEALAKLFPQGTSQYIPQEVSVSIPDYFGYINSNPNFDTLLGRAQAAQRAFSRVGADPAQLEYEMKNRLNNLAGGLAYTGGVDQGAKPLLPLLTSIDAAAGRLTSEQTDAIDFLVNNAETYNRLKQDIPIWEKEGNTAYLANQKPYFEQLGSAIKDYQSKLSGLDPNTLSSKELFALFPNLG
jgi:hypothetical protein